MVGFIVVEELEGFLGTGNNRKYLDNVTISRGGDFGRIAATGTAQR
jgi:hypothetical protein